MTRRIVNADPPHADNIPGVRAPLSVEIIIRGFAHQYDAPLELIKMRAIQNLSILMCLVFSSGAQENEGQLLKPCHMNDMECIRGTTQQFMEKTSRGIPEIGLKAIDPLEVPKLDYDLDEFKCSHHITDLNITGLKQLQITDFSMDSTSKQVTLTMNISVAAEGALAVDYHIKPKPKTATGRFTSNFKFLATTKYPYSLTQGEDGVTHYDVGAETTEFEMVGVPRYDLSKEFIDAINADEELLKARNSMLATQGPALTRAILKQLVDVIVPTLIHNLRTAAKILPITSFFKTD